MSGMMNAGAAWRHLRSDRSALDKRVGRATLRRVLGFAVPHRRTISVFLALTVVDASLVVASPLLVQRIVDDGILDGDRSLVALVGGKDRHGHFLVAPPPAGKLLEADFARCRQDMALKKRILYEGAQSDRGQRYR